MKIRRYLLLISFLTFFSCNDKKIEEIKPIVKSSNEIVVNSTPILSSNPEVKNTSSYNISELDMYDKDQLLSNKNAYCEKRKNITLKIDKPLNIAVTKDGSTVYVVNGKCDIKPNIVFENQYLKKKFCNAPDTSYFHDDYLESTPNFNIIKNNPIFKIKKNNNLSILNGDNSGLFYCTRDGNLTIDEYDNLYFSSNQKVFKVINEKETKLLFNLNELELSNFKSEKRKLEEDYFINRIIAKNNKLFLNIQEPDYRGNDLTPEQKKSTLSTGGIYISPYDEEYYGPPENIITKVENNNLIYLFKTFDKKYSTNKFNFYSDYLYLSQIDISGGLSWTISKIKESSGLTEKNKAESLRNLFYDYPEYEYNDGLSSNIEINSKGEVFLNIIPANQIIKIDLNNNLSVFAGSKEKKEGYKDGKGNDALFSYPSGMSFDAQDNLYVADTGNNAIRKITPEGDVSTFYKEKD